MRRSWSVAVVASLALTTSFAVPALAAKDHVKAKMDNKQEAPVCVSAATGQFEATISPDETSVSYTLSYHLTSGATVQQAHIHIGQKNVSGGITVWLCQSTGVRRSHGSCADMRGDTRHGDGDLHQGQRRRTGNPGDHGRRGRHDRRRIRPAHRRDPRQSDLCERALEHLPARGGPRADQVAPPTLPLPLAGERIRRDKSAGWRGRSTTLAGRS